MESTEDWEKEFDAAFNFTDADGVGTLDFEEVGNLFTQLGKPQTTEEVSAMLKA